MKKSTKIYFDIFYAIPGQASATGGHLMPTCRQQVVYGLYWALLQVPENLVVGSIFRHRIQ